MAIQIVATGAASFVDLNDARYLQALANVNTSKVQVYDPNTSTYNPNWSTNPVVITPELTIAGDSTNIIGQAKSITWYKDGVAINPASPPSGFSVATGTTGKPLTINSNVMSTDIHSLRIHVDIVWTDDRVNLDLTVQAEVVFSKVTQGLSGEGSAGLHAISVILSNEAHTIPTDSTGANGNYTNSGTEIRLYEGTTELDYDGTGTANGKWNVTAVGSNITAGAKSDGGTHAVFGNASAMLTGSDQASITYTITGKRSNGTAISITKVQSFSKSKSATTPTTYWMAVSAGAVKKAQDGTLSPTSVTATGFKQTGTGSPISDASYKFVVGVSTDGTAFTDDAATAAVASVTKTVAATTKALRFRMYPSSVTPSGTNFIDETIVPVLSDGIDGTSGTSPVIATVWAPNGTSTRNGATNLTAQCDVYDGVTLVTSGATYLWYKLISGTWTALTSAYAGYNTKTLTITPAQIAGQGSFKCVATYNSKTYEDTISVSDFSDPVSISIIIAEGNIFRNSEGTKNVTCRVFKANVGEIDTDPLPANQTYEYRWYLNGEDGTPYTDASWVDSGKTYKTGKSIQVLASQVTGTAGLQCELWTKS